jgi:hypothetical protein
MCMTNTNTTTKVLVYLLLSFLTCIMVVFLTSIPSPLSIPETCDLCNNNTENLLPIRRIVISKNSNSFFTYTDNIYGIKVRYAYDWSVDGTNYPHGVGGLQIVAFYLPDIVKGFPFLRIGIDNLSKEFGHLPVSINDYFDRSLKNKKNSIGFPDFKLIEASIIKGNNALGSRSAYTILWTYNHPIYGTRKSMEIGTIIGNNGYFVDYTAISSKFVDYLPIVQEMINSFEIINQKYDGQVPNIFYKY